MEYNVTYVNGCEVNDRLNKLDIKEVWSLIVDILSSEDNDAMNNVYCQFESKIAMNLFELKKDGILVIPYSVDNELGAMIIKVED